MTTVIGPLQGNVQLITDGGVATEYFLRFINRQILARLGGVVADSNSELADAIASVGDGTNASQTDTSTHVALLSIDELRSELLSVRNDCDQLRQALWERDSELLMLRSALDLRARVEQLEDLLLKAA